MKLPLFGFILTITYIILTIILFIYYFFRTIERTEVKTHDSTRHVQGIPSIDINQNILYFAFGLENPFTINRYIDETIYYPVIYLYSKEKDNGVFITKEMINLKAERCQQEKFGKEYQNLFSEGELDNSYCLQDYNFFQTYP